MAEYIDREAFLKSVLTAGIGKTIAEYSESDIGYMIRKQPAADVAPVKHGKWRWNQNGMDWGLGAWECSECACRNNNLPINKKINPLVFSGSKYCPNCGAPMTDEAMQMVMERLEEVTSK